METLGPDLFCTIQCFTCVSATSCTIPLSAGIAKRLQAAIGVEDGLISATLKRRKDFLSQGNVTDIFGLFIAAPSSQAQSSWLSPQP